MRRDKVIDALAYSAVIESDEELGFTVDGDTYLRRRVELGVGPKVTFIRLTGDARGEERLEEQL